MKKKLKRVLVLLALAALVLAVPASAKYVDSGSVVMSTNLNGLTQTDITNMISSAVGSSVGNCSCTPSSYATVTELNLLALRVTALEGAGYLTDVISSGTGNPITATKTGSVVDLTFGTLAVSKGGTGLTTVGTNGYVLKSNGTSIVWAADTDTDTVTRITSTAPLTANNLKSGDVTINLTGTVPVANGGTGLTTVGTNNQVLKSNGTSITWAADTDTNTTYTNGTGLALSGTTFSINKVLMPDFSGAGTAVANNWTATQSGYIRCKWNQQSSITNNTQDFSVSIDGKEVGRWQQYTSNWSQFTCLVPIAKGSVFTFTNGPSSNITDHRFFPLKWVDIT